MSGARTLTSVQQTAIDHPALRLQILACAGSGKTEVLARRAARLLAEGADPSAIIAFTFTEKAAAELKARIEARAAEADTRFADLPPVGRGMFVGTTHGWALRALQEMGSVYEMMDALTEEQEWVLLFRVARRLGIVDLYAALERKGRDKVATGPAVETFLRSAEVVHNERLDRAVLRSVAPQFASVLERYEWLLDEMRVLPFRLMIARAVDELAPGGRLRRRLTGRIAHVLVDEYQDFNRAQDQLLRHLAELGATVTVVGDDDQAIYQWRGGDVSLFCSFRERFSHAERVDLAENHRCRPEIVRFAGALMARVPGRLPKILSAARPATQLGAIEVAVAETPRDEARFVAKRIADLIAQGHAPGDIAVLYRSVRTSARPLVEELRARDIPCVVVGKTSLLARPETALIARLFVYWSGGTWYPDPEFTPEIVTREALLTEIRLVTGMGEPQAELALGALERIGARVRERGVADSIALLNEILETLGLPGNDDGTALRELGLGRVSELLTQFDSAARRAAPEAIYRELLPGSADEAQEDAALAADREEPLRAMVVGTSPGELYLVRLRAFLEEFAGRAAEETPDPAVGWRDGVQVMTVHQAKGLEFPIVFVPSLVEGRFPSSLMGRVQSWYVPPQLFDPVRYAGREEDEARLLYVALTRAKELLVLSWFEHYEKSRAAPSRFVVTYLREALASAVRPGSARPERAPEVHVKREPITLDFSSLITYCECPYRYRLRHVCGFQPPLARELGFGKLLHHLVAELARKGASGVRPTSRDVGLLLEGSFYLPFAGPVPRAKLRESARRRIERYVREYGDELVRTIRPEARFEVPLENGRLRGRIDLLLRAAGGSDDQVELIDFKTASNRPPPKVHENQLRLYAAAAERMGLEPQKLMIHDLDADSGGRMGVSQDAWERDVFREQLEQWVDGIRRGDFAPVEDRLAVCPSCDFWQFCRHSPKAERASASR
jgi:DNA helicase-2/ATP-dependent DNA helicase PcrA